MTWFHYFIFPEQNRTDQLVLFDRIVPEQNRTDQVVLFDRTVPEQTK
jgi:hypothetical protein